MCRFIQETVNGYHDAEGCPDEIPPDLAAFTGVIDGIQFELDKDVLRRSSRRVLDRAAFVLRKYHAVRIQISVHTSSIGSAEYNREQSRRRAEAVKRYLVEHGVEATRLEAIGLGPDDPWCKGNKCPPNSWKKDRRIESRILVD